jgi:hypothetical protein
MYLIRCIPRVSSNWSANLSLTSFQPFTQATRVGGEKQTLLLLSRYIKVSLSEPVLWIRIRNNPNVLAGSESEKKFGFGYGLGIGFGHCCRMKILVKNQKTNTWKRKILCFSIENLFWQRFGRPKRVNINLSCIILLIVVRDKYCKCQDFVSGWVPVFFLLKWQNESLSFLTALRHNKYSYYFYIHAMSNKF